MPGNLRPGHFHTLAGSRVLLLWVLVLCGLSAVGYLAARAIALSDHGLTGMSNYIPWGLPHVVAIFLILGAPGALHIATLGSLLGNQAHQPWSRLSGVVGVSMLIPGLLLLVLDLGRPGHVLAALPNLSFSSVFSWNLLLYIGFILIIVAYIAILMNRRQARAIPWAGAVGLAWRILLTTATASIFAVLPGRAVFPTVVLVILFISISWLIGTAAMAVIMSLLDRLDPHSVQCRSTSRRPCPSLFDFSLIDRLLILLLIPVLTLVVLLYGSFLFTDPYQGFARYIVAGGNTYTLLFWIFIVVGGAVPLWPGYRMGLPAMAGCILLGCLSLVYVLVVSSQGWQVELFPGRDVLQGSLVTSMAPYAPRPVEMVFSMGAVALSILLVLLAARVLPLLPDRSESVADSGLS